MSVLETFERNHDFLICVDSDGCVMDTMNSKHIYCFGPCLVEEWNLHEWREEILERWNEINLYQITRGINRFKGLALVLLEINEKYKTIPGVECLRTWTETTGALSNETLSYAIDETQNGDYRTCLEKALCWSESVNASIAALPNELKNVFTGAKVGLEKAHEIADLAVVTSANRAAVEEEWKSYDLYDHVDIVLAQEHGSKANCIAEMLKFGYEPNHVLMVGDALGDMEAAEKNGVLFFPILVNKEKESWLEFAETGLARLSGGLYRGVYQKDKRNLFIENFT